MGKGREGMMQKRLYAVGSGTREAVSNVQGILCALGRSVRIMCRELSRRMT